MLIDGNKIAKSLLEKLTTELLFLPAKKVCFVIFNENPVTEQFVKIKSLVAEQLGIIVTIERHSDITTTETAVTIIETLGEKDYDGIVVQLPLPKGIDTQAVLDVIPRDKDIDVLSTALKEAYVDGKTGMVPPVAGAVYEILQSQNVSFANKKIVIVGQGRLVGIPVHLMLKKVNVAHDIVDIKMNEAEKMKLLKNADIIISGTGVPRGIKPEMVKNSVMLIDAGTSEQEGGKLVGDIDPTCEEKALFMTPVPGGVGPVTVASLFKNLVL
ncbi:MAG: bifunctional 5,10-methylenetetrahydrofolate dehydrogenase/5,10-methenyltetrahydrofolate cyclohydrolase [bacterium]|nr:bifunctional 5,10-methylenetetrahydrofolate dehydrogenase/5,10-methenyltetrahydrofolate cyclohydrolase [bacterium]